MISMKGGGGAYQAKSGRDPEWGEWIKGLRGLKVGFGHGVARTRSINSLVPLERRFPECTNDCIPCRPNADFQTPPWEVLIQELHHRKWCVYLQHLKELRFQGRLGSTAPEDKGELAVGNCRDGQD